MGGFGIEHLVSDLEKTASHEAVHASVDIAGPRFDKVLAKVLEQIIGSKSGLMLTAEIVDSFYKRLDLNALKGMISWASFGVISRVVTGSLFLKRSNTEVVRRLELVKSTLNLAPMSQAQIQTVNRALEMKCSHTQ